MRTLLLLTLLLPVALFPACESTGSNGEEEPDKAAEGSGEAGGEKTAEPVNLLNEPDRAKLYFDIDQYTQRYMVARDQGNPATWMSLHQTVLTPLVDKNLEELLTTLAAKDEENFRVIAARGLGFGSNAQVIVPALVAVLDEPNLPLVNSSLVSLYQLASPTTPLGPLVKKLNHDEGVIRSNAALALFAVLRHRRTDGRVPMDDEVREAAGQLLAVLSDPREQEVRGHAAAALGAIGDPASVDVLVNLLADQDSFVRTRAAEGLGELGQEQALPPLLDALEKAKAPNEQKVIVASLARIARNAGYPCDVDALGRDPTSWKAWYEAVQIR